MESDTNAGGIFRNWLGMIHGVGIEKSQHHRGFFPFGWGYTGAVMGSEYRVERICGGMGKEKSPNIGALLFFTNCYYFVVFRYCIVICIGT